MQQKSQNQQKQDKTYGLRIEQSAEAHLTVDDEYLVWLDLVDCENLRTLILTAAAEAQIPKAHHERHLTLSEVPQLKHIENPQQLPLVVHLDARERSQPLLIEGPVRQIDFCWEHGEFVDTRNYVQVMLLPIQLLNQYRQEVEALRTDALLVLYAPNASEDEMKLSTVMQLRTAAQVVVTGHEVLRQLHVQSPQPSTPVQVCARQCRQLELVSLLGQSTNATANRNRVTINDCGRTRLKFTGPWRQINLVGCGIHRLSVERAHELHVRGVCYIEEVHVSNTMRVINEATNWFAEGVIPDINESTLRELTARLQQCQHSETDNHDLMTTCLAAVQRCKRSKSRYYGIHILSMLAAHVAADDIPELFDARKALIPLNEVRPYHEDLRLEAWRADVRLWHHLRTQAEAAGELDLRTRLDNFYSEVLVSSGQPEDSDYAFIVESLELGDNDVLALTLAKLQPMTPQVRPSGSGKFNDRFYRNGHYLKGIKRLVLHVPRLSKKTKQAAIEYVLLSVSNDLLQTAAEKLLQLEPALTRRIALRIANRYEHTREIYLRLALSTPQAAPQTTDIEGEPV